MSFNYYAKVVRILNTYDDYYIIKFNIKCSTKRFNNDKNYYDYYYKIYDLDNNYIKYTKFYQLDLLASYLDVDINALEMKILEERDHD